MSNLCASLPPRYRDCDQITLLLQAIEQELQLLEAQVQTVAQRGIISTADEHGLARWEDDLGLPHRTDLDLQSRRVLLSGALDRAMDCTDSGIRAYAARLTGGPVQIEFLPNTFSLMLTAQENRWLDCYTLQHLLQERLPLHVFTHWQLPNV